MNYYSFTEYCEDMEICNPIFEDEYWDYVSYCEMNNLKYDVMNFR